MEWCCGERVITAHGGLGQYLNDSSIWTRLVQEAGRKCDWFSSDILIWYESYKVDLERDLEETTDDKWMFGFRDCGVDGTTEVESNQLKLFQYASVFELTLAFLPVERTEFELRLRRVK